MNLALNGELEQKIMAHVRSGEYATAEDVIAAAMRTFPHEHPANEYGADELNRLIAEAHASGPPIKGEDFFKELDELRRTKPLKAPR